MSNHLNVQDLARLAQKALDEQSYGKEFMLEDVYNQTREAYERFPEDPVIRQVAVTIERMLDRSPQGTLISQADVSRIYNEFVRLSSNSKFRNVLGHLLLESKMTFSSQNPDYTRMNRVDADVSNLDTNDYVDQNLVNALNSAFGNSINEVKAFDVNLANKGQTYVEAELRALGFDKPRVEIMGGDQGALVYAAHLDSDKGLVTVAIPIELSSGKLLMPSTFVADDHLEELNTNNLQTFVTRKANTGDFSTPKAADVLMAIGILTGQAKKATQEEFSGMADLFQDSGAMALNTPNLYLDRKYEEPRADIDTTEKVEMPKELAHLAHDFENSVLEAASAFGRDAITAGKRLVTSELVSAGFKNAQVRFGSESSDSIIYLAQINTPKGPVEIEVPVEMKAVATDKYVPLVPSYFAYDGLIEDFSAPKLQRFAISVRTPSTGTVTYSTGYSYMLLPELRDEILKAASENDYVTCETILDHIGERFNEEDYKNSVADYQFILMSKARVANQEQHECSKMIPAGKGSIYARCGHFGIPMHLVVTGANGECMLKSSVERQRLNPVEESSAVISTSKINLT